MMGDAPETIWAKPGMPGYITDGPVAGVYDVEYRRADIPATNAQALANPKVQALIELLKEARSDLEHYVTHEYPKDQHPYYDRQWNRDMELCRRIDAALAALENPDG